MNTCTALALEMEHYTLLDDVADLLARSELKYRASEIAEELGLADYRELQQAIDIASEICTGGGVPVQRRIRRVFVGIHHTIQCDWLLSDRGYELIREVRSVPFAGRR